LIFWNLVGCCRAKRDLIARYGGDVQLALAAYNAGEDAAEHYGHRIPPFPQTQAYVPSVLGLYRALLAQNK
jgi:soluble lytic murein transglycosylase-like protein